MGFPRDVCLVLVMIPNVYVCSKLSDCNVLCNINCIVPDTPSLLHPALGALGSQ